jgi:diguanylate cyclase
MPGDVELSLRGPNGYRLAGAALEGMEAHQVWPTPLNFELWVHYVGDPDGPLGLAISHLLNDGKPITDAVAESLAAEHLPKARLNEEIHDAGFKLNEQLETISAAIKLAQKSTDAYGKALAGASEELSAPEQVGGEAMVRLVQTLASATKKVQRENASLEQRLTASTHEVSQLRGHLEQVRREAMTDALTALANRKALDDGLARQCAEADASAEPLTLAIVDIDHFKRFNDTWGHQTGDQVIRYVASVIARLGDPPRLSARFGGEEFAVLFPRERIEAVARELDETRRAIGSRTLKRRSTNDDLGAVTVSVGVAQYIRGEGSTAFIERADAALYASKRTGRDRVSCAEPDRSEAA